MSDGFDPLLSGLLSVAVLGWIERGRSMTPRDRYERLLALRGKLPGPARKDKRGQNLQGEECFSEALLVRTVPGATAKEFNILAECLGLMSYWPGGVSAFGEHWEAKGEAADAP